MSSIEANTLNSRSGTINLNSNLNLLSGKTLTVTGTGTTTLNGLLLANLGLTVTGGNTSVTTFSSSGLLSANLGLTVTGTSSLALTNISGVTSITNNTVSSSTSSGALVVTGGVGIGGDLFGTTFNSSGLSTLNSLTVTGATIHNGTVTISGTNTFTMNTGLFTTAGLVTITNATSSSSTSSGALVVTGGLGIGGNLFVGGTGNFAGVTNITNTAAATNNTTAALVVSGGIGVAKDCYIGNIGIVSPILTMYGRMAINSGTTINNQNGIFLFSGGTVATLSSALGTNLSFAAFNHFAGTTINATNTSTSITNIATVRIISAPIAGTNIINTPNFYSLYIDSGTSLFGGIVQITNNTASTSVSSGALIVSGGTGIGGDLFVGATGNFAGVTNITNTTAAPSISGTPSGALNVAGALALTGGSGQSMIMINGGNYGLPSASSRSAGSRLILNPSTLGGSSFDYAIGIHNSPVQMWFSTNTLSDHYIFYHNSSNTLDITNASTTFGSNNIVSITNNTPIPQNSSTPSGALNISGGIAFKGTNSSVSTLQNAIIFNSSGSGVPTLTDRSVGTRLVLSPTVSGSFCDYAIGLGTATPPGGSLNAGFWYGVPGVNDIHMFYHQTALTMILANNNLYLGTSNSAAVKFTPIHSVTQTTSPVANTGSTGFTTNGITGSLLVNITSLTANAVYTYTMNNALITTSSIILVSSMGDPFFACTQAPGSGSVVIVVRNLGASTGSGNTSINFFIIS